MKQTIQTQMSDKLSVKVFSAEVAGRQAFKDGKTAVPAQDQILREILKDVKVGQGIKVIKAWIRGFVEA